MLKRAANLAIWALLAIVLVIERARQRRERR